MCTCLQALPPTSARFAPSAAPDSHTAAAATLATAAAFTTTTGPHLARTPLQLAVPPPRGLRPRHLSALHTLSGLAVQLTHKTLEVGTRAGDGIQLLHSGWSVG